MSHDRLPHQQTSREAKRLLDHVLASTLPAPSSYERERTSSIEFGGAMAPSEKHPQRSDDVWFFDESSQSFGVFDGVGGQDGSEQAAQLAAKISKSRLTISERELSLGLAEEYLADTLKLAHRRITEEAPHTSTTATIVKIWTDNNGDRYAVIATIGDSRVYLLNNARGLQMLTLDNGATDAIESESDRWKTQEKLAQVINTYALTDGEKKFFEYRHVITAALGYKETAHQLSTMTVQLEPGETLLLTTDGIHDNLTTGEIQTLLAQDRGLSAQDSAERLIHFARERSRLGKSEYARAKMDDMTAVIARV